MSDAGEFIDAALQREANWYRADDDRERIGGDQQFYGASVGAVRGTIRDVGNRYPGLGHDDVMSLSSELWSVPVFERRLAAVVLLQTHVPLLIATDLTRLEGFVRTAGVRELVDPLATDVIGPMIEGADAASRSRMAIALDRWAGDAVVWVRRAVLLSPLRALRDGAGDWDGFVRRARLAREASATPSADADIAIDAIDVVTAAAVAARPELGVVR